MDNVSTFLKMIRVIMVIMFIVALVGVAWNASLMADCINSGSPNSQACFKYNVLNNNLRSIQVGE
jgi:lipopolysaccharide export system protein LptC